MRKPCPECDRWMGGDKCNSCGWQAKDSKQAYDMTCAWMVGRRPCRFLGTIGFRAGIPGKDQKMYCSWHTECLSSPKLAEDALAFEEWLEMLRKDTNGESIWDLLHDGNLWRMTQGLDPIDNTLRHFEDGEEKERLSAKGHKFLKQMVPDLHKKLSGQFQDFGK